tara:strand:- start:530 stop:781 length:252 start_codon:yes stop_codon:yes gene_type:complete
MSLLTSYINLKTITMKIILTPQEVVKMSKNKVDENPDLFKESLSLEEASSLVKILIPRLENIISNRIEENIYDDLMDINGHND